MLQHIRKVYFFGYGADCEPDLIRAVTGHTPKIIGPAMLNDYELRIQELDEITQAGDNPPRQILHNAWGGRFRSYVIVPKGGASVRGMLYRISLHDRHLVDKWELVSEGWYDKAFVEVALMGRQKTYRAETQVLAPGQSASVTADGDDYDPWLMSRQRLLDKAVALQSLQP